MCTLGNAESMSRKAATRCSLFKKDLLMSVVRWVIASSFECLRELKTQNLICLFLLAGFEPATFRVRGESFSLV